MGREYLVSPDYDLYTLLATVSWVGYVGQDKFRLDLRDGVQHSTGGGSGNEYNDGEHGGTDSNMCRVIGRDARHLIFWITYVEHDAEHVTRCHITEWRSTSEAGNNEGGIALAGRWRNFYMMCFLRVGETHSADQIRREIKCGVLIDEVDTSGSRASWEICRWTRERGWTCYTVERSDPDVTGRVFSIEDIVLCVHRLGESSRTPMCIMGKGLVRRGLEVCEWIEVEGSIEIKVLNMKIVRDNCRDGLHGRMMCCEWILSRGWQVNDHRDSTDTREIVVYHNVWEGMTAIIEGHNDEHYCINLYMIMDGDTILNQLCGRDVGIDLKFIQLCLRLEYTDNLGCKEYVRTCEGQGGLIGTQRGWGGGRGERDVMRCVLGCGIVYSGNLDSYSDVQDEECQRALVKSAMWISLESKEIGAHGRDYETVVLHNRSREKGVESGKGGCR
ncbi:hypothetical protein Tco_0058391 [Tanacetum coccineum]